MKQNISFLLQKTRLLFVVSLLCFLFPPVVSARVPDKGYNKTLEAFSRVVCDDGELFQYNRGLIRGLNYTNMLVLRSFSRLDSISPEELVVTLRRLVMDEISYDNQLLLGRFVTLDGADMEGSWQFLERLETLDYSASRVMTGFELVDVITARDLVFGGSKAARAFLVDAVGVVRVREHTAGEVGGPANIVEPRDRLETSFVSMC